MSSESKDNEKIKQKLINLKEESDEEQDEDSQEEEQQVNNKNEVEEESNEIEDTFSQDNENNDKENDLNSENDDDSEIIEEEENSEDNNDNSKDKEENSLSEEMILKDELENVDFKSLLKAKAKLSYENSKKSKINKDNKKFNKNTILTQMEKINKNKKKAEPKEYSAKIKPHIQFKNRNKSQNNSSLLNKKFSRDPRFDDLSGNLNEELFKKNFSFVNDMAKDYVDKLQKFKKLKKYKKKLTDEQYELLKKQNNYIKSWINQQKQKQMKNDIKKEINKENKERYSKGQKPIFVNDNKLNKYIKNKNMEKHNK